MWPFRKAAAETRASLENPSVPLSDVNAWRTLMGEWHGVAGVVVTHETALEVPACKFRGNPPPDSEMISPPNSEK